MGLEQDIANIQNLTQRSSSAQSEAYEKLKQLQEKIKSGESTGDRIKDFLIVNLGTISAEQEKPYRDMQSKLEGQTGSQILVIKQQEAIHGCPGIIAPRYIDPMFIGIDKTLELGVLTGGLELDIQNGNLIFPTQKHVKKYDKYEKSKWQLEEDHIKVSCCDFMNLGKEVPRRTTPMPNDFSAKWEHGLLIHVGSEVEQYFRTIKSMHPLDVEILKRKEKELPLDISYVEALNLLEQDVPMDFKARYDKHIYQQRIGVIDRLEQLTQSEAELNGEIKSIYDSIIDGEFMRGGALTLIEDEDDAGIVSMRPRMELKKTQEKIQYCLKQAIELEMHKQDLRLERKPGVIIEIPRYIASLCEKYKVEAK